MSAQKDKKIQHKTSGELIELIEELQAKQHALEKQNQELQAARNNEQTNLALYMDLYDNAPIPYFSFKNCGVILKTNHRGALFFQMERSKIIGRQFLNFIIEEEKELFKDFLKKVFQNEKNEMMTIEVNLSIPIMKVVKIEAITNSLYKEVCRVSMFDLTNMLHDEISIRRHQRDLKQIQGDIALTELSTAIAHEVNQPLSVIGNYVNGCINRLESNVYEKDEILKCMKTVSSQVELAGKIIQEMKSVLYNQSFQFQILSINEVINALLSKFMKEIRIFIGIPIEVTLSNPLPPVRINSLQIELVILNLLRNSFDVLKKASIDKPQVVIKTYYEDNRVYVTVNNNGPMFSMNEELYMFEPKFTTKNTGMGMGLAICRKIIETHSGHLSAHNVSNGVCFQISLPIAENE